MIPETLKNELEDLLGASVQTVQPVSGGSINQAAKVVDGSGTPLFLKWNSSAEADMFPKEEQGLKRLAGAESGLRVPSVIGTGRAGNAAYIIMEYIAEGSGGGGSSRQFGRRLAALHRVTAEQYGLDHDNYIGRLPQSNTRHERWIDFFREERLKPQLRMAINNGKLSSNTQRYFQRLYNKLAELLADEPASLLHGDLWGGNFFYDAEGRPAVFDPAVYYGNREIEMAFTHLFGGFANGFYEAYHEAFPLQPAFDTRKDIYNLYPLLVHTNLFGGSYARRVQGIVQRF